MHLGRTLLLVVSLCALGRGQSADRYLRRPDDWFKGEEGARIAANILSWQAPGGSWPKNLSTTRAPFTGDPNTLEGTFDNNATVGELRFLARAFTATRDKRDEQAFLKGFGLILQAQYPTGGWPQFYPPGKGYPRYITFNDGAMVRLMEFLRDVAAMDDYAFVAPDLRRSARAAFDRGIRCILECQVRVDGKPTVWCAQHDEKDYQPRGARTFELVSLSGSESVGVLKLLMDLDDPSPEVVTAIRSGAAWFASVKIEGLRQRWDHGNKVMVADPNAPALWARFYEIGTNRPFFSGRDGVKKYDVAEIEAERRNGYAWYGTWGRDVAAAFDRWCSQHPGR